MESTFSDVKTPWEMKLERWAGHCQGERNVEAGWELRWRPLALYSGSAAEICFPGGNTSKTKVPVPGSPPPSQRESGSTAGLCLHIGVWHPQHQWVARLCGRSGVLSHFRKGPGPVKREASHCSLQVEALHAASFTWRSSGWCPLEPSPSLVVNCSKRHFIFLPPMEKKRERERRAD